MRRRATFTAGGPIPSAGGYWPFLTRSLRKRGRHRRIMRCCPRGTFLITVATIWRFWPSRWRPRSRGVYNRGGSSSLRYRLCSMRPRRIQRRFISRVRRRRRCRVYSAPVLTLCRTITSRRISREVRGILRRCMEQWDRRLSRRLRIVPRRVWMRRIRGS